jgi:hypothetical protein
MYLIGFYSKKSLFKLNKFDYYKTSFNDLKAHDISVIYFYQEDPTINLSQDIIDGINNMGVKIISFTDDKTIIAYLQTLSWRIFINTFEEQEIYFTNKIRAELWQKITDNPDIFLNKYLQRKTIGDQYPETIVRYKSFSIQEAEHVTIKDFPSFPCIIKPTWWIQSSWVCKINNFEEYQTSLKTTFNAFTMLGNKKLTNQSVLIEEFIDGKMYTIDYYVDEDQHITMSKPVFVKLWVDYGINDFSNISRFIWYDIETEVDDKKLHDFIKKTVIWWGIRNTFVHHEFKITTKWQMKTIEINGRIWWFRLDMYQLWYDINLLRFPFIPDTEKVYSLKQNIAMFALYPQQTATFHGYHQNIIKQITSLPSFYRINKWIKELWATIWLTHNWYGKVWSIELANSDIQQFKKDVDFLENNYFNIINTDSWSD